jgi:hypothetical protein
VIYYPDEYQSAIANHLTGERVIVLAGTGYSSIKEKDLKAWGIDAGKYEEACYMILRSVISSLRSNIPGVTIKIAHGASSMGVDNALMTVARDHADGELGFSCPEYLLYVEDDLYPVYCATDKLEYSRLFVQSLDILLAMNGRDHALFNDMLTAIRLDKRLVLLDVVSFIGKLALPLARNSEGKIEDAVTAFYQVICPPNQVKESRLPSFGVLCAKAKDETLAHTQEILKKVV